MNADVFSQHPYRWRLDWGRRGAGEAAERGDVLVVVDVLSFSTAVATAVERGGVVYPCAEGDDPAAMAARLGAELAVSRRDVPVRGRFSLSPPTFEALEPGTAVVVASPNGATCARSGRSVPALIVGALVNARAAAAAATRAAEEADRPVTVVACGERWGAEHEDGGLRFALEDYLGAGAILSYLPNGKSPEAQACEAAFLGCRDRLRDLIWDCASGRELRDMGFPQDVEHAARLDVYGCAPVLRGERLEALGGGPPREPRGPSGRPTG